MTDQGSPTHLKLARIAEGAEVRAWTDMIRAATPEMVESLGLAAAPMGGGIALIASRVPSVLYNRAFGFGLDEPVDEATMDRAIALFRRDAPFSIQPCPEARPPGIGRWLEGRGLPSHFNWVRWIRETTPIAEPETDLEIERIDTDRADAFVDLAFTIFSEPKALAPWTALGVGRPGWSHYLTLDRGTPVGVAALHVADGVGWLGWGGTLASHRGRGGQTALIARRVGDAAAQGCRWLTVETADDLPEKPNPSFRNLARAGFHLLYRRPSHAHFPPDEGAQGNR